MTSGALRTIRSSLARASAADSAGAALPLPLPPERIRSVAPRRLRLPPVGGRQASIRLGSGRTPSSSSLISRIPIGHVALERRSEEHTSELQSLMRISYAVFCLKKKKKSKLQAIKHKHNPT